MEQLATPKVTLGWRRQSRRALLTATREVACSSRRHTRLVLSKVRHMNPRPTLLEDRAARSHREAIAMIETERALREAKTARLRALRLAKESEDQAPAAKPGRRKKPQAEMSGTDSLPVRAGQNGKGYDQRQGNGDDQRQGQGRSAAAALPRAKISKSSTSPRRPIYRPTRRAGFCVATAMIGQSSRRSPRPSRRRADTPRTRSRTHRTVVLDSSPRVCGLIAREGFRDGASVAV